MAHLSQLEFDRLYKPIAGPVEEIPEEVDVCIVGGGPVGLMFANLLGDRGIKTLLLEKCPTTSDQPKAIAVSCEFRRMLDWLGLTQSSSAHLSDAVGIKFISPLGFNLAEVPRMVTPNGFPAMSTMSQPMFERVLLKGAQRYASVSIAFGTPLASFQEHEDHVELTIGGEASPVRRCRARFVVGCDGAHSMVRKQLGIEFTGHKHDEQHLVLDLATYPDQTQDLLVDCDPRRPRISIPAPYGGRRLEFMLKPGEDQNTFADEANIKRLISQYTDYQFEDIQIVRALVYTFSERTADKFSEGRAFLAGDAAHIMPPFGGQGLNTGVRDVLNLTWKLEGVLNGSLPQSVLNTYEPERRDHVRDTIKFAHWMGTMTNSISWAYCMVRDLGLAAAKMFGPVRRHIAEMRYVPQPVYAKGLFFNDRPPSMGNLVGRLFPRFALQDAEGQPCSFDDVASKGFMLVGVDVDGALLRAAASDPLWLRLKPQLISIARTGAPANDAQVRALRTADPRGAGMLAEHAGEILVLRPDRHVAGAAQPGQAAALFARLEHALFNEASGARQASPAHADAQRPAHEQQTANA